MNFKKALIIGINGQDGSYLAELLISKNYIVHGIVRKEALEDYQDRLSNLHQIFDKIKLHQASLDDNLKIFNIIKEIMPDECYHFASQSFVNYNFDNELKNNKYNFFFINNLLSAIVKIKQDCKIYFAGSSEMFGNVNYSPQDESTSFNPRSIYGISKVSDYYFIKNYRNEKKLFISCGISYNHESPRRHSKFVSKKITSTVAKIYLGLENTIELGNIEAQRDWGYAPDYVIAMHSMLQKDYPDDFVLATGSLNKVHDFLEMAFRVVNLDYKKYLKINYDFYRPNENIPLCGDAKKARNELNFKQTKSFDRIVEEMVLNDINTLKK
jgi:GDPmannose 4,6-dehydratase